MILNQMRAPTQIYPDLDLYTCVLKPLIYTCPTPTFMPGPAQHAGNRSMHRPLVLQVS